MSKSVKKIHIAADGEVSHFPLTVDAYDTFDDLRLHVAEDQHISFGALWKSCVVEQSAIKKIVVAIDDTVQIYQLV